MKNKFLSSLPIVFGVLGLLMLLGIILAICIVPIYVEIPTDNVAEALDYSDITWTDLTTYSDTVTQVDIDISSYGYNAFYVHVPYAVSGSNQLLKLSYFFDDSTSYNTFYVYSISGGLYASKNTSYSSYVSSNGLQLTSGTAKSLIFVFPHGIRSFRFTNAKFADVTWYVGTVDLSGGGSDPDLGNFGNYLDYYSTTVPEDDEDLFTGLGVDYVAFNNPYKNCVNMLTCQSKPFDSFGNVCTLQFSYLYNGVESNGVPEIVVKQYTYEVQGDVVAHYPIYDFGLQILDSSFNKGFYITNYTNDFVTYFKDMFYFYNGDQISSDVANTYYNNGYKDGFDDGYADGLVDNFRSNFYGNYAFEITSISQDGSPEFSSILNTVYLNTNVLPDFTGIQFNSSSLGINYINFVDFVLPSEHVLANYPKGINVQYDINGILSHNPIVYKLCLDNTVLYSYTSNYDSATDKFIVDESSKAWNNTVLNQAFTNIGSGIYSRNAGVNADNELLYIDSSQLNEYTISNKFLNTNSWGYWIANASMYDINYIKQLGYNEAVADYQKNVDQAVNEAVETTRDVAYWNGFNKARKQYTDNDYTFLGLMSAIVEAPVTMILGKYDTTSGARVGGLFNFELLGVNLSGFYLSILTLGVVIFIIKFALGRTSKDE